jgi:SAM-dependent methyltransferase
VSTWTAGYAADLEYSPGFYHDQSPIHLNLVCLFAGVEGVSLERSFTYCELGCGQGYTAMLLAAANPQGDFHAVDFNPAHIARARADAEEAGIPNIRFYETSFEELVADPPPGLPEFDFVTLHGVYSWVSVENRRAIVHFLRRYLKPGGVAYVSYNAMPGWAAALPVQRLLNDCAKLIPDRSDRQMGRALAFAEQLKEAEARSLRNNPFLAEIVRTAKRERFEYLVHEYLNGNWNPLYHADVAREMAEAKLDFVAPASLLDGFPDLNLTPHQRDLLASIGDSSLRETLKDYCVDRRFRKDVFLRGARRLSRAQQDERLRQLRLALVVPRSRARLKLNVPIGEASLEPRAYGPILDALADRPRTVGELLDLPEIKGKSSITAQEVVGMLVGSGQALPMGPEVGGKGEAAAARFNRMAGRRARDAATNSQLALAAAAFGTGLYASALDLAGYFGLVSGTERSPEELARLVWGPIAARGEKLIKNGEPVEDEAESLALLREWMADLLRDKVPLWERYCPF